MCVFKLYRKEFEDCKDISTCVNTALEGEERAGKGP